MQENSPDDKSIERSPTVSSPETNKAKARNSVRGNVTKESIADVAAGPAEESVFVPKKEGGKFPTQKKADVDDDKYRIEPLELQEKKALEMLDYYNQKCDKKMRLTFGQPDYVLEQSKMGLKPTWIVLRQKAKDAGMLIFN